MTDAAPAANVPELTVSELSAALKRTVEDAFGYVRVRGEISGFRGPHSSGHCYFALKDDERQDRGGDLEGRPSAACASSRRKGSRSSPPASSPPIPARSNYQIVIEQLEPAGVGALMALLEERKKKLAAEGLFDAARKQLAALPAERDRRRHLADRRGDPRHPAPARRPLSAPRAGVAGAGAGRRRGRADRRRHPRLQRASRAGADPAARCAHRRARRRLARRPVVLQRGDRGARRRREHDPADLGGRPRDRHDADRFRRRPARADADRRRRNGGAGARRADRRSRLAGAPRASPAGRAAWRHRRTELRAAVRALPTAAEVLAVPRQRLDSAAAALPRALRASTHAHHRRYSQTAAKLTLPVLSAQVAHARHRLDVGGDRMGAACRRCCAIAANVSRPSRRGSRRRCAPMRRPIARGCLSDCERMARLAERARRAVRVVVQRQTARVDHAGQLLGALSYRGVLARGYALVRDAAGARCAAP